MSVWDKLEQEPVSIWDEVNTEFVADEQESSYAKQALGGLVKGGMRIGQAILEMPKRMAWLAAKIGGIPTDRPLKPGDIGYLLYKEEQEKMKREPDYKPLGLRHQELIEQHKQGREAIIRAHPEWESEPAENFLDLVTSPRKLSLAIIESAPLLVSAGLLVTAGQPHLATAMMYSTEGQEMYDQAIADGATNEQAEQAYHIYGSVAAILESLQLRQMLKFGKKSYQAILNRTTQKIAKQGTKSLTKDAVKLAAQEAIEEMSQGTWQEVTAKLVYDKSIPGDLWDFIDRRAQEGLIGGVTSLIPGIGGATLAQSRNLISGISQQAEITPEESTEAIANATQQVNPKDTPEQQQEQLTESLFEEIEVTKVVSRFPQKITDQKSLEEVGNAIARHLGVDTIDLKWRYILKPGEKGIWGNYNYAKKEVTLFRGTKSYITEKVKGLKASAGFPWKTGVRVWPSQANIKRFIIHELGHKVKPLYFEKGAGKAKHHHPEFAQWVEENVKQLFEEKKVIQKVPIEKKVELAKGKEEAIEKPAVKKLTRRKALILGHKLPKIAGMDEATRRDFMENITGKRSMKGMSLEEMQNYINALQDVTGKTAEIEPEDYKRPITLGRKATTMEAVIDETLTTIDKLTEQVKIPKHVRKQFIKKQRVGLWGKFKAFAYGIDNSPLYGLANILENGQRGVLTDVFDTNIIHGRRIEAGHKRTVSDAFSGLREELGITDADLVKISKSCNPRTAFVQNIQEKLDYGTEIQTIEINEREYDLTRAELLDIFLMAQQEDGLRHLLGGGLVINGVETGALSEETIRGLTTQIESDDKIISLANIIHNVGENIWKPSLNQTAATLGEKEIATIDKWWGLEVLHPTKLAGKQERFDINFIENKSILKDRTKSKDPLIVRDALARFTGFENAIAEYVGMSQPTRIARTVLNNKEFNSVLNRKGYKDVRENMFEILDRAQSIPAKQGSFDRFFKGVLPGIYRSVLFFNPRVIMSQFTSTTNYAAYVSPKYMTLIKEGLSPEEVQKTLDMSDIAWDRFYMGHSSLELGELGASDATLKLLTKTSSDINKLGITLKLSDMGALTVGRKIAEAEYVDVQKGTIAGDSAAYWAGKDTSFEIDSEDWKRAVIDRAELLWQRSQPSWDKWSRSMITSDPAATRRLFFLFRSFHEKSLAILQDAQIEYKNSSKSAEDTARYAKKYGAVLSGYTINVALRALIMAGLVRGFKEPIQYLIDMITAPFAMLPVLGKVLQTSIRAFINVLSENRAEYRGEAIESFPIRVINTIAKAPENFSRAAAYTIMGETDKATDSVKKAVGQIYEGVGTSAGVPVSELNRVYGGWIKEEEPAAKPSKREF